MSAKSDALAKQVVDAIKIYVARALEPVNAKLATLEARAGVSITAQNVQVPGMENVAAMMGKLDATLREPVKPVYDGNGRLVSAAREPSPDAARIAALEDRIAALEARQQ